MLALEDLRNFIFSIVSSFNRSHLVRDEGGCTPEQVRSCIAQSMMVYDQVLYLGTRLRYIQLHPLPHPPEQYSVYAVPLKLTEMASQTTQLGKWLLAAYSVCYAKINDSNLLWGQCKMIRKSCHDTRSCFHLLTQSRVASPSPPV